MRSLILLAWLVILPAVAFAQTTTIRVQDPSTGATVHIGDAGNNAARSSIVGDAATDLDDSRGFLLAISEDISFLRDNATTDGQEGQAAPDKGPVLVCYASVATPSAIGADGQAKRGWCDDRGRLHLYTEGTHGGTAAAGGSRSLGEARKVNGTAVSAGQDVRAAFDPYGRAYTLAMKMALATSNATPITTTTSIIAAPGASTHLAIHRIHAVNGNSTPCDVSWADGSGGTQYWHSKLPEYGLMSPQLNGVWHLTSNTALSLVLSTTCSIDYTVAYEVVVD